MFRFVGSWLISNQLGHDELKKVQYALHPWQHRNRNPRGTQTDGPTAKVRRTAIDSVAEREDERED
jgi:hypothetical protein